MLKNIIRCSNCGESDEDLDCEILEHIEGSENNNFEFGGTTYSKLCKGCIEILEDEFSDLSHIIPNESEGDFWDSSDISKIAENGRF